MTLAKPITHLIFDLDNTLIHSDACYETALRTVGMSSEDLGYVTAKKETKLRLGTKHVSSHSRLLYFKNKLDLEGQFSPQKLLDLTDRYEKALAHEFKKQWDSLGRLALIQKLKKHHTLGIITNENTRTQMIKMRAIDPDGTLFPVVITSEEAGVEKPNEQIFSFLEQRLKMAAPDQFAMVGDSVGNDLIPASKRGYFCYWTKEFLSPDQIAKETKEKAQIQQITVIDRLDDLLYNLGHA